MLHPSNESRTRGRSWRNPRRLVALAVVPAAFGMLLGTASMSNADQKPSASTEAKPADTPTRASEPKACVAEELPQPDGFEEATVSGGDETGRYLLGMAIHDDGSSLHYQPVMWQNGKVEELTGPPGAYAFSVTDVNSSGVIIGDVTMERFGKTVPWIFANGEYTMLPSPAEATTTYANSINNNGDIVGAAYTGTGSGIDNGRPLRWPADDPDSYQALDAPMDATATGISDNGAIIGYLSPEQGEQRGYVWKEPNGAGESLVGPNGTRQTKADSIAGPWIAGEENDVGALWNLNTGKVLERSDPLWSVNESGDVLMPVYGGQRFLVRPDGSTVELPGLPRQEEHMPNVIFNRGSELTAAGDARFNQPPNPAVVWRGC